MKKGIFLIFTLALVFIAACQQAKKEVVTTPPELPKVEMTKTTEDSVVVEVGKDLNNVNNVEEDLSTEEFSDLDTGLTDLENI